MFALILILVLGVTFVGCSHGVRHPQCGQAIFFNVFGVGFSTCCAGYASRRVLAVVWMEQRENAFGSVKNGSRRSKKIFNFLSRSRLERCRRDKLG